MKKLTTLVASILLSLGGCELAVRALGLAPTISRIEIDTRYGPFVSADDPRLVYKPKPGFADINAYGIRDRDRDLEKGEGIYRILILGDSVAFGLCSRKEGTISREDVFPTRLERALNAEARRFEVINLAVSGYNTLQETIFFEEKGLPLSPDLVIVAYVLNDHIDRAQELERFQRHPDFERSQRLRRAIRKNALLRSALARAVWYQLGGRGEDAGAGLPGFRYTEIVSSDLEPLRWLSEKHGFAVLVAVFPALSQQRDGVYSLAQQHDALLRVAKSKGFDAVDLLPGFLTAGEHELQRLRGRCTAMHLDEFGHQVAAQLLYEHIKRQPTFRPTSRQSTL